MGWGVATDQSLARVQRPDGGSVKRLGLPVHAESRAVVAGVDAAAVRRRVGPVAWCVMESVVAAADSYGVARVSIRSIAADLGVSKNTVQRAMTALRTAEFVAPVVVARGDGGRFAAGAYRVYVAGSVLARVDYAAAVIAPPARGESPDVSSGVDRVSSVSRPSRRRAVGSLVVEQLSLLPEA